MARGEYVWIAESDDYADERLLEQLIAILEAEPKVAFAYCRSWRVSRRDGFIDPEVSDGARQQWTANYIADGHAECPAT
jgi:hypothetical protein